MKQQESANNTRRRFINKSYWHFIKTKDAMWES
jgi:hypothetical protein